MNHVIASRNIHGYALDDADIQIITTALNSSNPRSEIDPMGCHTALIPPITDPFCPHSPIHQILSNAIQYSKITTYPRKFVACLNLPNRHHWTVLEIIQISSSNVHCIQYDTDGYAYPVPDSILSEVSNCFAGANPVSTIDKRQKKYSFSGQHNNNCGIISSLIMDDIRTGRMDSSSKPLDMYGGILSKHDCSRAKINHLIEKFSTKKSQESFAKPKNNTTQSGNFFDANAYIQSATLSPKSSQIKIYNALMRDLDLLNELHTIIDSAAGNTQHIFNALYQNESLKKRARFLFKDEDFRIPRDSMPKSMGTEWIDTVTFTYQQLYGTKIQCLSYPDDHDRDIDHRVQKNHAASWTHIAAFTLIFAACVMMIPMIIFACICAFVALLLAASKLMHWIYPRDPALSVSTQGAPDPYSDHKPQSAKDLSKKEPEKQATANDLKADPLLENLEPLDAHQALPSSEHLPSQSIDRHATNPSPASVFLTLAAVSVIAIASSMYISQSNTLEMSL